MVRLKPLLEARPTTTATAVSAIFFVSIIAACVWLLSPSALYEFHVFVSGYDDSAMGGISIANHPELAERCHRAAAEGRLKQQGACGIHYGYVAADDQMSRTLWYLTTSLWYPLILSGILPVVWLTRRLIRSRLQFSMRSLLLTFSAISVYLGAWILTRHLGIADVLAHADTKMSSETYTPWRSGQTGVIHSVRVDSNPLDNDSLGDRTCHYLGNASSPLPLVVVYDWASFTVYQRA